MHASTYWVMCASWCVDGDMCRLYTANETTSLVYVHNNAQPTRLLIIPWAHVPPHTHPPTPTPFRLLAQPTNPQHAQRDRQRTLDDHCAAHCSQTEGPARHKGPRAERRARQGVRVGQGAGYWVGECDCGCACSCVVYCNYFPGRRFGDVYSLPVPACVVSLH